MIARTTRKQTGLSRYLRDGKRQDSIYSRSEKDNVKTFFGNLNIFEATEKFLYKEKDYSSNYLHITLSFSKEDEDKLNNLSNFEEEKMLKEMVKDYIFHHTSGYLEEEIIAYAELHSPKIKQEKNKERYKHIHIAIALYNPVSDTKLRTTFARTTYIDDTLQARTNMKFGLSQPRNTPRKESTKTETKRRTKREELIKKIEEKKLETEEELILFFTENSIKYKKIKTKNNTYYKVINNIGNDINLRGKGFEKIEKLLQNKKDFVSNRDKNIKDLDNILISYYATRKKNINKRRSEKTKEKLKKIEEEKNEKEDNNLDYISSYTTQQKLFFKHYQYLIDPFLKLYGYFISSFNKENEEVKLTNKKKNIEIVDRGDSITSNSSSENLEEKVKIMLEIAKGKGWKLHNLIVKGSLKFREEVNNQIALLLQKKRNIVETKEIIRPISEVQSILMNIQEKKLNNDKNIDLTDIKDKLRADVVLAYTVKKYKLNISNYTLTDENKINNLNNKQKPKNVIDFLQKEVNLSTKEAISLCKDLYQDEDNIKKIKLKKVVSRKKMS